MLGNHNKMDVIGHQAEGQNTHAGVVLALTHQVEIDAPIEGGPEHDLAIGPALGDVVSIAGQDIPGVSWHTSIQCRETAKFSPETAKRDGADRPGAMRGGRETPDCPAPLWVTGESQRWDRVRKR